MIYITFFIVILIDKRGVREAERGGKDRIQIRIQIRYKERKEACTQNPSTTQHRAKEACQPAAHPTQKRQAPPLIRKEATSTHQHTPAHTSTHQHTPAHHTTATHRLHERTHAYTHAYTHACTPARTPARTHGGAQARSG